MHTHPNLEPKTCLLKNIRHSRKEGEVPSPRPVHRSSGNRSHRDVSPCQPVTHSKPPMGTGDDKTSLSSTATCPASACAPLVLPRPTLRATRGGRCPHPQRMLKPGAWLFTGLQQTPRFLFRRAHRGQQAGHGEGSALPHHRAEPGGPDHVHMGTGLTGPGAILEDSRDERGASRRKKETEDPVHGRAMSDLVLGKGAGR